ncbi:MAG: T9SS type A sorting domain-containing protein [Bacteroidia bacterium]|nr:T9SS type A sorting domain-containing protein [Bacteroidia bacterium]
MKALNLTLLSFALSFGLQAQKATNVSVDYKPNNGFAISKPLGEMPVMVDEEKDDSEKQIVPRRRSSPLSPVLNKSAQPINDPIAQNEMGSKLMSPPIVNWQGVTGTGAPPDPSGAAGPGHYVQAVNVRYNVYNKTGTSLGGPYSLNTLWAGSTNMGDPIVLYDKYADRWFVSQFNGADKILVAISTSSNPLGTYYTYTFVPSPGNFPDYPKFSIWADGYYCTSNIGGTEKFAVFDRTKMLTGNPTAGMISLTVPPTPNYFFFSPLPADADGTLPPYGTPCPIFCYEDDAWSTTGGVDQLRIFKLTANWTTPLSSTLILDQTIPTASINAMFNVNYDDVTQPGTSQKIDAIGGVFTYRAQYRRWTGYNSVVLNHAVIVNATTKQTGLRWYELRQNTTTGVWSIYQSGTYAPDLHSRFMGSMAMDDNGSIGIAYAVSSGTIFPSIRYTGRLAGDPLGQLTFTETTAIAGTSSQTGFNRFGDYSQTSMDPDGITFWHTGEYMSSGGKTRIFSWQIPLATGINELNNKPDVLVFQNENSLNIKGVRLPNDNQTQVDVFDILGKLISAKVVSPVANSLETTIDISGFAKGTYLVRIGNEKFQKVVKVSIN